MADRRIHVRLDLRDNFTGRLAEMANAAQTMHVELALAQATWEPHDWDSFPCA